MSKIFKEKYKKSGRIEDYEEEKEVFEKTLHRPYIVLKIELPEGYEEMREEFIKLEKDGTFLLLIKEFVEKTLLKKKKEKTL
jgi:hypothetical protein